MQSKDKISKASWNHFANVKDLVLKNITIAVQNGTVKVDQDSLPSLLALVNNSLDEGYHKGARVFDREVISAIDSDGVNAVPTTSTILTKKKLIGTKKLSNF